MTFFYDLNKRLADLAVKQDAKQLTESAAVAEKADYSAKKAAAGKDIGKPGKAFAKIAKSAGKEYGSKAAGERVAGAVLNKLRAKESVDEGSVKQMMHKDAERMSRDKFVEKYPGEGYFWDSVSGPVDESALQAYIGDKKYGKTGMDALRKAGREGASKDKMSQIRNRYNKMDEADMEEGNEFSGELAQARASGAKQFKVDGKSYPVKEEGGAPMTPKQKSFAKLAPPADKITFADKIAGAKKEVDEMLGDVAAEAMKKAVTGRLAGNSEVDEGYAEMDAYLKQREKEKGTGKFDKKKISTGTVYTRKMDDEEDEPTDADGNKIVRGRGRPKGKDKGPERVTGKSYKYKAGRPAKTKEDLDTDGVMMTRQSNMSSESINPADRGEYDREGDMALNQLHQMSDAAKELHAILDAEENLPEWVQSKITKALDYLDTARDYMKAKKKQYTSRGEEAGEPVAEKAVSKKQQKFMGMVHAAQKGEKPASKEVGKVAKSMGKKDAEDFAKTKHKGLPEKAKAKKEESVEETAEEPKEKKAKGGYNFGGGVYESLDRQFAQALTEGMNVSVNMSTGEDGQARKNITVSADGEDADKLAELLKMAGLGGQDHAGSCSSCGTSPCGCAEQVDENQPDWPTNTETSDDAFQYSGGLNKPKSTGQSTTPVLASQLRRQVSMEEGVTLERTLFNTWKNYKAQ
jgi:phage anti-repressor protein